MSKPSQNAWFVYILQCGDGSFYTGITNDVTARLMAHQNGTGAKYTKGRSPLTLVYQEECVDRSAASKREMDIKNLTKADKSNLVHAAKNLLSKVSR